MRAKFTDETLVHYLLGTGLTAQQREEVEDAYFRDNETFRRAQELELELVEAYVSEKLPEEERKVVAGLIGRSAKLQQHARFVEALGRTAFRTTETVTPIGVKWMRALRSFWGVWKFASAIATAAAVLLMIGYFVVLRGPLASVPMAGYFAVAREKPPPYGRLRVLLAPPSPSGDAGVTAITLDFTPESVDFVVPDAPPDCTLQSFVISSIDRNQVVPRDLMQWWKETIGQGRWYTVVGIPATALPSGNWKLTVDGRCGTAPQTKIAEYRFIVNP